MAKKVLLKIASGDPNKPADAKTVLSATDPNRAAFDVRDHLASLIAGGNNLSPEDKKAVFQGLANALGQDQAQKVLLHAYTFNNRPDVQRLPVEEKLKTFYNIGSTDPGIQGLLTKTKALGYGVIPGFRESSSGINQQLAAGLPVVAPQVTPESQKKIMISVKK